MKAYITFQIRPTELLKGLGYTTKKFAVECSTQKEKEDTLADLSSLDCIQYLRVCRNKPHNRIMLPTTDYHKHIHL